MKTIHTFRVLALAILAILILLGLLLDQVSPAAAQTATPSPTPVIVEYIEISGRTLALQQSITMGDIAVVIVGLFLAGILVVYVPFKIVTHYLP